MSFLARHTHSFRDSIYGRRDDVAHLVIRGRAVPHAPLSIQEELLHHVFRMREWEFSYLPALRIETPHEIHFIGGVPKIVILIDPESVWGRALTGQLKLLKSFSLGVEPRNLATFIFGKPNRAIGNNPDARRQEV